VSRPAVRYYVTVRGEERVVELVEEADGKASITLDGRAVDADLVELHGSALHSLLVDGQSREMVIDREGDRVWVWLDGERIETVVRDEVSRALASVLKPAAAGPSVVEAPMPGVVVSVAVKVGDDVAAGQPVVVVEAMKMQNELSAEAAGIVESIEVKPGQTVDRGAALVRLRAKGSPS
jgi:biotin carboxyl carrier protein